MAVTTHPPTFHSSFDFPVDDDATSASDKPSSMSSSPPFSPAPSSSCTSLELDGRSVSPAPSVYSMTSSIREQSYRVEYGRGLNNYSEVYRLPADPEELERLEKQHRMFAEIMGKYVPPLWEVMADDGTAVPKACLDLGCGNGDWIMDVARDFPNSQCVAVDLVPMQSLSIPVNCRSEVDDINLGLEHFYGSFDVVHARLVSSGIKDYYRLLDQASRVLRPGGLIDLTEFDFRVYDLNHRPITPSFSSIWGPHGRGGEIAVPGQQEPWLPRWMAAASQAARRRGGHVDAAALLHRWISQHKAFEDVEYREFWIPTARWMQGDPHDPKFRRAQELADIMCEDIQSFLKSGRPLLLGSGLPADIVDELEAMASRELSEARTPLFIRVQNVYARKRRT